MLVLAGLRPDPDEGRDWLARELAHPDYHRQSLLDRLRDWLVDLFDGLTAAASDASSLATFAGIVVAVAVGGVLLYAVPRIRRDPKADARREGDVLAGIELSAADLRVRAELELADGRLDDALGDAFRALVLRQVEERTIEETVGSTAHELADRVAERFTDHAERLAEAAALFDAVVYGDHPADSAAVRVVLDLDDDLRRARPTDQGRATRRALAVPR